MLAFAVIVAYCMKIAKDARANEERYGKDMKAKDDELKEKLKQKDDDLKVRLRCNGQPSMLIKKAA